MVWCVEVTFESKQLELSCIINTQYVGEIQIAGMLEKTWFKCVKRLKPGQYSR
jgi:hypothetical protein